MGLALLGGFAPKTPTCRPVGLQALVFLGQTGLEIPTLVNLGPLGPQFTSVVEFTYTRPLGPCKGPVGLDVVNSYNLTFS